MKKKTLTILIAVVLVVVCAIGGTLAWLTDKSGPVTNTFVVGDINIILDEVKVNTDGQFLKGETVVTNKADADRITSGSNSYKIIPGTTYVKDPKVTVKAGSEACWLFVKVERSTNFDSFMSCQIRNDWTKLTDGVTEEEVYYKELNQNTTVDTDYPILVNDEVTVLNTVTKAMLTANDFSNPSIAFTAYAVQKDNITTVGAAWTQANNSANY